MVVRSVCRVERQFAAKRARARGYNIPSSPTKVAFATHSCIKMYCESCKSTDRITQQTYPWRPNANATGVREWQGFFFIQPLIKVLALLCSVSCSSMLCKTCFTELGTNSCTSMYKECFHVGMIYLFVLCRRH